VPPAAGILDSLAAIANDWRMVAVFWHIYVAGLLVTLFGDRRPSQRAAGGLLVLPLISVSVLAWSAGNPFNGTVFGVLATFLAHVAWRITDRAVRINIHITGAAGVLLLAFAWVYPHFLAPTPWTTYLVAGPLGLLPCPTLAAVIGLTLLLDLLGSRAWSVTLGLAGLAYGVIGVLGLGVILDAGLLVGAIALLAATVTSRLRHTRQARPAAPHRADRPGDSCPSDL
jgi:hypothetical protein